MGTAHAYPRLKLATSLNQASYGPTPRPTTTSPLLSHSETYCRLYSDPHRPPSGIYVSNCIWSCVEICGWNDPSSRRCLRVHAGYGPYKLGLIRVLSDQTCSPSKFGPAYHGWAVHPTAPTFVLHTACAQKPYWLGTDINNGGSS